MIRFFSTTRRRSYTYNECISLLNSLQSNATTIASLRASGNLNVNAIPEMHEWARKAGVEVDSIPSIHVAGTKGKGSTCSMVNAILRRCQFQYGHKARIGIYTSPHLVTVRERIRVDGEVLSREDFAAYFTTLWDKLSTLGIERPVYFRFLTLLAFHIFAEECVDVIILECGVGGEHDSTNVIKAPIACGITKLGIDHVAVLGDSIESIAWHKAGIMKRKVTCFTVPQEKGAMDVLRARAIEKDASLEIVDEKVVDGVRIGLNGDFQRSNAALAVMLANAYLVHRGIDENLSSLPREFVQGLEEVEWPGRCEIRKVGEVEYCLDGAHTSDSMMQTMIWFNKLDQVPTTLIFNQQTRDAGELLKIIHGAGAKFVDVIFCTNQTKKDGYSEELISLNNDVTDLHVQERLAETWSALTQQEARIYPSIEEALASITTKRILITGSLHLVGGVMALL